MHTHEEHGRRRVVVTGATGNVGTALLRRLAADGDQVVGIARRVPAAGTPAYAGVEWRPLDLTADGATAALAELVRGADAVVHLAWGFQPSHRLDLLEQLGVEGTRRVAEAAAGAGVPHLVHMSSVGAYAPRTSPDPVDESYPTSGVPTSPYSRHKAAAERVLDWIEERHHALTVTRLRPGIIGQEQAGSALVRYALPGLVPAAVIGHLPVLPIDRRLAVPVVHADDVADAVSRVLERRPGGAFNLATEPVVTAELVGRLLGARVVPVPARVLRAALDGLWRVRLAQLDPGWLDLAYAVPLLDTSRAADELGWQPTRSDVEVLTEVLDGMAGRASGATPVLRRRTVTDTLRRLATDGPVHQRREP